MSGFKSVLVTATELANELDIECEFKDRRKRKKKKQFSYESEDEAQISPEKLFETECCIPILDQAIMSLITRFEGYQEISKKFGFLWNFRDLQNLDNEKLHRHCKSLEVLLSGDNSKDIDGEELFMELKFFRNIISKDVVHVGEILNYLMKNNMFGTFPNIKIIYKILFTFTITVASGERSFSKLKLIKTYLRATMSQQRLCGLATMSIETIFSIEPTGIPDLPGIPAGYPVSNPLGGCPKKGGIAGISAGIPGGEPITSREKLYLLHVYSCFYIEPESIKITRVPNDMQQKLIHKNQSTFVLYRCVIV